MWQALGVPGYEVAGMAVCGSGGGIVGEVE